MARTLWYDARQDRLLSEEQLRIVRRRAAELCQADPHLFADELEALRCLGVLPLLDAIRRDVVTLRGSAAA